MGSALNETDEMMIDFSTISPTSLAVMSKQATINVGTIGHVAHGKSTVVRALSGVQTVRFKNEKERNITIRLGYANAKLYKCTNPECPQPECYSSGGSHLPDEIPCKYSSCNGIAKTIRHISFVDCPGHDILMATMLNGAAVMDAVILLIAANETCPQPQTSEHLAAVEIMKLRNIIILQNKVELIKEEQFMQHYDEIKNFVKGTSAENAPIVPISAILGYNMDIVVQYLCEQIAIPHRDFISPSRMIIIRSFDVNKPGDDIYKLKGGVAGGSILKGVIHLGDSLECRPGIVTRIEDNKWSVRPIKCKVASLYAENNSLKFAVPGGLIGVGTTMDPSLTRADGLVGHILGAPGSIPDVYEALEINYYLMRRLIGGKTRKSTKTDGSKKPTKVKPLEKDEYLMINIGSTTVGARISSVKNDLCKLVLAFPVCTRIHDKIAISRKVDKNWRLIGWGQIIKGRKIILEASF